jgi:membrane protein required for beta-lactamase induction
MTLITILAGLLLERWFGSFESWRRYSLIINGLNALKHQFKFVPSNYLLACYLALPVIGLFYLEYKIGTLLFSIIALAIFIFTIGPRDLEAQAESLIDAWKRGDRVAIHWYASDLIGDYQSENTPEMIRRTIATIFQESLRRYFAIFFWFITFGAAGALFYRMVQIFAEREGEVEPWLYHLYGVLSWLPCRLLAFSFGLAGSFVDSTQGMRNLSSTDIQENLDIVERCGFGALRLQEDSLSGFDNELIEYVIETMALLRRTVLVWLALLAVAVLSGWSF